MRGRSTGVIGVYIGLNGFQPEPDEVQAMDGYPVSSTFSPVSERMPRRRRPGWPSNRWSQPWPTCPRSWSHNVEMLVAAYLPGAGTHTFDPGTTLDDPDLDTWRPWVVGECVSRNVGSVTVPG